MTTSRRLGLTEHNRRQRDYFEQTVKRTMIPTGSRYLRRHVDEALRFAGIEPAERVLEVGCGMGRYTLILAERGVRIEALDLSPVLLEQLKAYSKDEYEIPLHCADVIDPPPGLAQSFDVVLGFFVLHHLHALDESMTSMARLLKPGGRMVFLEPNPMNPLYYVQMLITPGMMWRGDGGIVRMRRGPVLRAMARAGLERRRTARFGFFPPFLANLRYGPHIESVLERVPLWHPCLPFQLFAAELPRDGAPA